MAVNIGGAADVVCLDLCRPLTQSWATFLSLYWKEMDLKAGEVGGCLIHRGNQLWVGWDPGQPDLVVGNAAHGWGICRWIIFNTPSNRSHSMIF